MSFLKRSQIEGRTCALSEPGFITRGDDEDDSRDRLMQFRNIIAQHLCWGRRPELSKKIEGLVVGNGDSAAPERIPRADFTGEHSFQDEVDAVWE
jgi:hypothetical protein